MANYSLVPVDYQPEFDGVSLVPVDYDPFSDDGAIQQAAAQPGSRPQQPANGAGLPDIGAPTANPQATGTSKSYDPDSVSPAGTGLGQPSYSSAAAISASDKSDVDWSHFNQPFGELKPATFTPTQRIGNLAADALTGLGMQPYTANDLASRIGNLLGLTPLGDAGSVLDLIDAKRRDDLPGVLEAAAGMIPGAKGVVRGVGEELHHAWPKYLGGAIKQELVALPTSLHREFHKGLDMYLPKNKGTAYYESRDPAAKQQALQTLAAYTKKFDADHGTKLYDALLKNGFTAP